MEENNKLALIRNDIAGAEDLLGAAGAEDLLIAELDDRLELSVLLLSEEFDDANVGVCDTKNTNCAGANCVAGCT